MVQGRSIQSSMRPSCHSAEETAPCNVGKPNAALCARQAQHSTPMSCEGLWSQYWTLLHDHTAKHWHRIGYISEKDRRHCHLSHLVLSRPAKSAEATAGKYVKLTCVCHARHNQGFKALGKQSWLTLTDSSRKHLAGLLKGRSGFPSVLLTPPARKADS